MHVCIDDSLCWTTETTQHCKVTKLQYIFFKSQKLLNNFLWFENYLISLTIFFFFYYFMKSQTGDALI